MSPLVHPSSLLMKSSKIPYYFCSTTPEFLVDEIPTFCSMNPFKSYEKTTAFGATFQRFQTQPGRAKGAGPLSAAAPSRGRSADVAGRGLEAEGGGNGMMVKSQE